MPGREKYFHGHAPPAQLDICDRIGAGPEFCLRILPTNSALELVCSCPCRTHAWTLVLPHPRSLYRSSRTSALASGGSLMLRRPFHLMLLAMFLLSLGRLPLSQRASAA